MSPVPTGLITINETGDLVLSLTRLFANATADDVWASITEPERTARWFGTWRGEGKVGSMIEHQMAFEEGAPWDKMRIDACEPPNRLVLTSINDYGNWIMELKVRQSGSSASLELIQHQLNPDMAGDIGPGWEYYLDMLVASRTGSPQPVFTDYHPGQSAYYAEQVREAQYR